MFLLPHNCLLFMQFLCIGNLSDGTVLRVRKNVIIMITARYHLVPCRSLGLDWCLGKDVLDLLQGKIKTISKSVS